MLDRRSFGLGLMMLAVPETAGAHGPTRQKVKVTAEINASPDKVWAVIGNFHDMSWLPLVEKTEGKGGNAVGAIRQVTLKGRGTSEQELDKYDAAAMSYSYRIIVTNLKVLPVTNYSSHLGVKPAADGKSLVEWRGAFYRGDPLGDPPPELNDEAAKKAVRALYETGLTALKTKLEGGS